MHAVRQGKRPDANGCVAYSFSDALFRCMGNSAPVYPGGPDGGEAAGSGVVLACEGAWRAIQRSHPGVPDVVVVLGTGAERGRLVKLGHWWGGRWIADGQVRGEVLLAGEALHLAPAQVFEVLLHEAAHGLNAARGIKDSSRGGRYHNARFKATAEEVGLVVEAMPPYGWAQTALGPEAIERYDSEITQLGEAMRIARRLGRDVKLGEHELGAGSERDTDDPNGSERAKSKVASCGCGRKLRMAPTVLAQGPVLCGLCGREFSVEGRAHQEKTNERAASGREPVDADDRRFLDRRAASLAAERVQAPDPPALRELDDELTPQEREGAASLARLVQSPGGIAAIAAAGAWYESQQRGEPGALVGHTEEAVAKANAAARAFLQLDGTLTGPAIRIGEREVFVGELVMTARCDNPMFDVAGRELPPAGVLGTITTIDSERGVVDVDFPIVGRHRVALGTAAAALEYGYAEHRTAVGAPLIDLRTLPPAPSTTAEPLAAEVELTW